MEEQEEDQEETVRIPPSANLIADVPIHSPTQTGTDNRILAPSETRRRRFIEDMTSRDMATQTSVFWPPDLVIPEGNNARFKVVLQEIDSD